MGNTYIHKQLSLVDLIDVITIEHFLIGFCEKFNSGMKIAFYDNNNEISFIKEMDDQTERLWSEICKVYRRNYINSKSCSECDKEKVIELFKSNAFAIKRYKCRPLMMTDIIAPIIVNNTIIGAVITGQRILDSEAEVLEREICEMYPEQKVEYREAFQKERSKSNSKICTIDNINQLENDLRSFVDLLRNICEKLYNHQLMVKKLEDEKNHRETFFERVAHSMSLPIEAILVMAYNLLHETGHSDNKQQETKKLFDNAQSMCLLVQNILHGSEEKTMQGKTDFVNGHIITTLHDACEMFSVEAEDKGCKLKISLKVADKDIFLDINDLKDINLIYKKIIKNLFDYSKEKGNYYIIKNKKVHKMGTSDLIEQCYRLKQAEFIEIYDPGTGKKREIASSQLSKYYLCRINMNPEIMDLAFKNLLHNAVKYSFETVPSSSERFVSIRCIYCNDNIDIVFENYGVGITIDEIKEGKIWKSRYRGYLSQDRNRTGAGLGLAHVKWAIESVHKGKISCYSNRQGGDAYLTRFIVSFNVK